MIRFEKIWVTSDEQRDAYFIGSLDEFAVQKLNERIAELPVGTKVISVEPFYSTCEFRLVLCNSDTWYKRDSITLKAYLDVPDIVTVGSAEVRSVLEAAFSACDCVNTANLLYAQFSDILTDTYRAVMDNICGNDKN